MKKIILLIYLIVCASQLFAQGPPRNNQYWRWDIRTRVDSSDGIPDKDSLRLNTIDSTCQIFVYHDSILVYYSHGVYYQCRGGNSIDTTSLSNRIEARLYISDTLNAFGNRFLEFITSPMIVAALNYTPVPSTRNISINGTVHNLSTDAVFTLQFAPAVYPVIAGTYSYTMQSGQLLEKIEIIEPTSVHIDIGTTIGAHDVAQGVPCTTGYANFSFNYYASSGTTLYFTGATSNTIFKIYTR